jgi:hypothetical protein
MPVIGHYSTGWATVDESELDALPLVGHEAMAYLRTIYDDVQLVGVFGSRDELTTALVNVQEGVLRAYVALQWGEYHGVRIYCAEHAWEQRSRDGRRFWVRREYMPEGAQDGRGPDDLFVWGEIQQVHRVNGYVVIESIDPPASNAPEDEQPRRVFHINGVDGRRVSHGWRSLDLALLHCMNVRAALVRGASGSNIAGDTMAAGRVLRLPEAHDG